MTKRARRHPRYRRRLGLALLSAAAAPALACSDSNGPDPDPDLPDSVSVSLELVAQGLTLPLALAAPSGDSTRVFVAQQGGRIRVIRNDSLQATPFLDIDSLTVGGGEQGLLGLAFHPEYETNGHFYVNYTDTLGDTRVVRYSVTSNPEVADPASAFPILFVDQPFANHNGGHLAFGPDDMLYIGMGDGGDGGDPHNHGQDLTTLLGSMLRIDVDAGSPYAIPLDNPFVGHATAREETWAYGLRNPWRWSFDRQTGDLLIADVGQNRVEEVSFQPASSAGGENYGWRVMEGSLCYNPSSGCSTAGLTLPIHEYDHSQGCSITGGYVYRGARSPSLVGRYFFSDSCRTWLRSFAVVGGDAVGLQDHSATASLGGVVSYGEDARGELYVVSFDGTVRRIVSP